MLVWEYIHVSFYYQLYTLHLCLHIPQSVHIITTYFITCMEHLCTSSSSPVARRPSCPFLAQWSSNIWTPSRFLYTLTHYEQVQLCSQHSNATVRTLIAMLEFNLSQKLSLLAWKQLHRMIFPAMLAAL